MKFPKEDAKIQYKPDSAKPVRQEYDHPGLTRIQRACRTRLTLGYAERDMTNKKAADNLNMRRAAWAKRASAENATYAVPL